MLKKLNLKDFIDELGSNSPAPGGGSAAALSASLAGALVEMVFNLTVGKKKYLEYETEVQDRIKEALTQVISLKDEFLELMERDTEAFLSLMEAFKMPGNTQEEIEKRKAGIEKGNKAAIEIPMEVAEKAYKLYDHIVLAARYGNRNAISDAGVSASLAETAVEGALLNVKINALSLKDKTAKDDLLKKCNLLLKQSRMKKDEIFEIVEQKMR